METRANYATIGLFTLAVIVACFAFVYWLARYDESGVRKPMRILVPGSVTGLATGSQVLFNGIRIGDVTSLRINPDDPNQVETMVSVDPNQPIKDDTKVSVGVQGLTGLAYIDFRGGTAGKPSIFAQEGIPTLTAQGSGLQDVIASAQDVIAKVNTAVDQVNGILSTADPKIQASLTNVQKFTDALSKNSDGVEDFMGNVSDLSKKIGSLSGNLEGLVKRADGILAAVDPAKVSSTLDSVNQVTEKLAASSESFPKIIANVEKVSGQLSQTLDDAQKIVQAVQVEAVKNTITDISTIARRVQTATVDIDKIVANADKTVADARDFVAFVKDKQPQVDQIVADSGQLMQRLNAASARLDTILGKAQDMLTDPQGKSFFAEATAAAHSIRIIAEAFQGRADQIASNLASFSGQGLRNVNSLVEQLRRATASFDQTVTTIGSNPQGVIFGNPTVKDYNRK
ncbi:MlaD family protein [Kaistia dalseonensis]|uniref:Phospholipid/cholesterol/gamma-HCH transport system substrate-binding protein n=1 Tax=Kaistia dalseonensis TaxID=410840 RepID=A0ABU0H1E4_9HYPH|nr:MlaD family protein [Kaistia dalseonensis]MCX5493552.1 MlaD family protein [Kaistia dalseonensis]MDQ0436112.1 phospholipid/cholesterol/gamma-HCH transport system substrate-binding protein [Kaistia dalseonensis]